MSTIWLKRLTLHFRNSKALQNSCCGRQALPVYGRRLWHQCCSAVQPELHCPFTASNLPAASRGWKGGKGELGEGDASEPQTPGRRVEQPLFAVGSGGTGGS